MAAGHVALTLGGRPVDADTWGAWPRLQQLDTWGANVHQAAAFCDGRGHGRRSACARVGLPAPWRIGKRRSWAVLVRSQVLSGLFGPAFFWRNHQRCRCLAFRWGSVMASEGPALPALAGLDERRSLIGLARAFAGLLSAVLRVWKGPALPALAGLDLAVPGREGRRPVGGGRRPEEPEAEGREAAEPFAPQSCARFARFLSSLGYLPLWLRKGLSPVTG